MQTSKVKAGSTFAAWLKDQIRRELEALPDSCAAAEECSGALDTVDEMMDYLLRLGEEYRMYQRETRL